MNILVKYDKLRFIIEDNGKDKLEKGQDIVSEMSSRSLNEDQIVEVSVM